MDLFTHSIILTKRFERYGGDSEHTLALIVDRKGAYLYHSDKHEMKSITSYAPYVHWLIHNSMDLLDLARSTNPLCDWWYQEGDRNAQDDRRKEFKCLLNSF